MTRFSIVVEPRLRAVRRRHLIRGAAACAIAGQVRPLMAFAQVEHGSGHSPFSTPTPKLEDTQPLVDLLAFVPARLVAASSGINVHWYFADVARQMAALGISQEFDGKDEMPDEFLNALRPLALGSNLFQFGLVDEMAEAIGFRPFHVQQALTAGTPPDHLTVVRGGIDLGELPSAWTASGYEEDAAPDGTPIWTIGRDAAIDPGHPIQRMVLAQLNNLAIVDDVVICGSTISIVEDAISTFRQGENPVAADPALSPVFATLPESFVSGMALLPEAVPSILLEDSGVLDQVQADFAASDDEAGPMPGIRELLFGVTAGLSASPTDAESPTPQPQDIETGEGRILVRIITDSSEDAAQAVRVVEYRWGAWQSLAGRIPYAEMMELVTAEAVGSVASFAFLPVLSPGAWLQMVSNGDALPFLQHPPL